MWKEPMILGLDVILGIETSCDETAAAVVEGGARILSNVVASQVDVHAKYGGVVPEIASRRHLENIVPVTREALDRAGLDLKGIDGIAVTCGPGLAGALLVGVCFAKALSLSTGIPLVGVNHLQGHVYANWLTGDPPAFPLICLVVSGGHTDLLLIEGHDRVKIIGRTRDDAAGEAFDKAARVMGLGYPGGPLIDRLAQKGRAGRVRLPRAYLEEGTYDFSFSGLKTAVVHAVERLGREKWGLEDLAAEFQEAVAEVLVHKTMAACQELGVQRVILAGGVAANSRLRTSMTEAGRRYGVCIAFPPPSLCTDNAAMIAAAGYYAFASGHKSGLDLTACADMPL